MKIPTLRRAAAAAIAPALAAGMMVSASSAQAAANSHEAAAATWLHEQPKLDGLLTSYYGPTRAESFVDYGLNLDLWAALDTFGNASAEKVYDAVIAHADEYTDAFGARYAGATGKLTAMVQRHGDSAGNVGGRDLVAETEELVSTTGTSAGRAFDQGAGDYESSNTIGQSWVVKGLAGASSELADDTADYLAKQQCDDGSFRLNMADTPCTTGGGSVDTTAFAVQALDTAGGHDADVQAAVNWLAATQAADGSFKDEGVANTNSTGLAAVVLASHDQARAAHDAAGWVAARQVKTGDEEGVIALNDEDFAAATAAPIARVDRDRYVRASVQAILSLSALQPATQLTVTGPAGYVSGGKSIAVTATGLEPGESFTARVGSAAVVRGSADATGKVTASVPTPTTTATSTVIVHGSNADRSGKTAVKVLGAKTLAPKLKYTSVRRGGLQKVTVSGLAAGESVKVYQGSSLKKSGVATSTGTYSATFKVGSSKGTKTVKVIGAFTNRTGKKNFKVT
ncbi:MAG: prenyltransferase/squalene oxidase repeat-containing protein [Aeromicrobium sp.]